VHATITSNAMTVVTAQIAQQLLTTALLITFEYGQKYPK